MRVERESDHALLDGFGQSNLFPVFCCLGHAVFRIRARADSELTLANFDKFNLVAGLKSKLLPNVCGEGYPTVEGDHC